MKIVIVCRKRVVVVVVVNRIIIRFSLGVYFYIGVAVTALCTILLLSSLSLSISCIVFVRIFAFSPFLLRHTSVCVRVGVTFS